MEQPKLLPPSLGELIPEDHLVRVVNCVIEQIDIKPVLATWFIHPLVYWENCIMSEMCEKEEMQRCSFLD